MPLLDGLKESWYYGNAKWYLIGGVGGLGFVLWWRHSHKGTGSTTSLGTPAGVVTESGSLDAAPVIGGATSTSTDAGSAGLPQDNATRLQQAVSATPAAALQRRQIR